MGKYTYEELEQFTDHIGKVMDEARETGSYTKAFSEVFVDDATYRWGLGPTMPDFYARGKDEILKVALGAEMAGTDGWKYPQIERYTDPEQNICCYRWIMESPWLKEDGTYYAATGYGYTAHWYAGNMKSLRQEDWCESDTIHYCHALGVATGLANQAMCEKVIMRRKRENMASEQWKEHLEDLREEYGNE